MNNSRGLYPLSGLEKGFDMERLIVSSSRTVVICVALAFLVLCLGVKLKSGMPGRHGDGSVLIGLDRQNFSIPRSFLVGGVRSGPVIGLLFATLWPELSPAGRVPASNHATLVKDHDILIIGSLELNEQTQSDKAVGDLYLSGGPNPHEGEPSSLAGYSAYSIGLGQDLFLALTDQMSPQSIICSRKSLRVGDASKGRCTVTDSMNQIFDLKQSNDKRHLVLQYSISRVQLLSIPEVDRRLKQLLLSWKA